jgi:hypothetical protein
MTWLAENFQFLLPICFYALDFSYFFKVFSHVVLHNVNLAS